MIRAKDPESLNGYVMTAEKITAHGTSEVLTQGLHTTVPLCIKELVTYVVRQI